MAFEASTPPLAAPGVSEPTTRVLTPTAANERIVAIDIIRGFALFGVLMLNLLSFSGPTLDFGAWAGSDTWWDRSVELFLLVGGEAAFYSIFSLLFGLGVALQIQRADRRGEPFALRHLSRMGVLLVFGLLHEFLIWDGDILTLYAISGCWLLLFARRKPDTMIIWGAGLGLVVVGLMMTVGLLSLLENPGATPASELDAAVEQYGNGSFGELLSDRLGSYLGVLIEAFLGAIWFVPIFLTGMWIVASGKLADWRNQRQFLVKVLRVSLPIALVAKAIYAAMIISQSPRVLNLLAPFLSTFVGGPALGVSFTCMLFMALQRRPGGGLLRHLAPVGRMALTNYLMQSVAAVSVFYGFGLGLYGQLGIAASAALGVMFFALQIVYSSLWLRYFRFGPMERLWRAFTYRRV